MRMQGRAMPTRKVRELRLATITTGRNDNNILIGFRSTRTCIPSTFVLPCHPSSHPTIRYVTSLQTLPRSANRIRLWRVSYPPSTLPNSSSTSSARAGCLKIDRNRIRNGRACWRLGRGILPRLDIGALSSLPMATGRISSGIARILLSSPRLTLINTRSSSNSSDPDDPHVLPLLHESPPRRSRASRMRRPSHDTQSHALQ